MTTTPEWGDWPVTGPRTTLWVLKWIMHRAGTPLNWHLQWVQLGKLNPADPIVLSHEFACRALESAVTYDQLDTGSLAAFEIIARQLQTCEDVLSFKFYDPREDQTADLFLMTGAQHKSQLCISPELKAFSASETQKEAAVLKERRKAKEERVPARPKSQAGKGPNAT